MEKVFDEVCKGHQFYGPFFDHVLEFWIESLKMQEKILFLKYEEMKIDPEGELKKLAAFLGRPFSNEEQVEKVLWRSSFDRLFCLFCLLWRSWLLFCLFCCLSLRSFDPGNKVDFQKKKSFDRLKNLEVNKNGVVFDMELSNKLFFRRGIVGDWKNYFTNEMKKKLDEISCMKLEGSGLDFEM
ncbi:hypothetical protein Q3G72_027083 [Acer saccharum]|nr:hypothetical protein Q3G72_027083 [Acer saccharum]